MFGIIADSLTTATSVLFPVFASYKAIRTSDPAQLTPWLMYWTTLSLFMAGESFFHPILSWTPFYSWLRLGLHLYLVLPGQQGSVYLYRHYLHPWLDTHEREIDNFITEGHDKAKAAGLQYVQSAIEYVKTHILGFPPRQPTPPTSRTSSYSQTLLSRFAMPTARPGVFPGTAAPDLLGMLGSALSQATSSRSVNPAELKGELIPAQLAGAERRDYIATQRERLRTLLAAFDAAGSDDGELRKSKSEAEFEDLAHETFPDGSGGIKVEKVRTPSGGWGRWVWGNYGEADSVPPAKKTQ